MLASERGQAWGGDKVFVGVKFADAVKPGWRIREVGSTVGARHYEGACRIRYQAAVEDVERLRDRFRVQNVVDGDWLCHMRVWVTQRMVSAIDRDRGHLFPGRAELVHVALCDHRVEAWDKGAVGVFEIGMTHDGERRDR